MRSLPPLTALRAFEAAARHLSFKAAAAELALTPTAVSHQVRLLEDSLATRLFRRRPRPLALTSAGARLFPAIRGGLDAFAAAVAEVREGIVQQRLRVTATNAFAARWLVPRLQRWRDAHPEVALEVIGTDAVLDLAAGNADVAIRYGLQPPAGLVAEELARDRFWPVGSPALLASGPPVLRPSDLARFPFIHALWPETYPGAPTWRRWLAAARKLDPDLGPDSNFDGLSFTEELHAIDAVVAGQGIGLLSDVLLAHELATGALLKLVDLPLAGFGFYVAYLADHPRQPAIEAFIEWLRGVG